MGVLFVILCNAVFRTALTYYLIMCTAWHQSARRWERIIMKTFKDICFRLPWFFSCGRREDAQIPASRCRGLHFLNRSISRVKPDPYKVLQPPARNWAVISGYTRSRWNLPPSVKCLLTSLVQRSSSWEANSSYGRGEHTLILWSRRVHCHALKSPPVLAALT